uniref:Uncharacterized protein n=1 Tax=Rhizophora mucronata TaxID=61149 RepID=A0A2P2N4G0_RHIMU
MSICKVCLSIKIFWGHFALLPPFQSLNHMISCHLQARSFHKYSFLKGDSALISFVPISHYPWLLRQSHEEKHAHLDVLLWRNVL